MPEARLDPAAPLRSQHPEPFHGTRDRPHSGGGKLPPSPAGGFTMTTQLEVLEAEALKLPVKEPKRTRRVGVPASRAVVGVSPRRSTQYSTGRRNSEALR